jgi:hypothetical protein
MHTGLHVKCRYSGQILMTLEFFRQIFEQYSNIKFHENPFGGSRVVLCGRTDGQTETDTMKLIVAFRNFANAPKNACLQQNLTLHNKRTLRAALKAARMKFGCISKVKARWN